MCEHVPDAATSISSVVLTEFGVLESACWPERGDGAGGKEALSVQTSAGSIWLVRWPEGTTEAWVEQHCGALGEFGEILEFVPQPIRSVSGSYAIAHEQRIHSATAIAQGAPVWPYSRKRCYMLGQAIGRLHSVGPETIHIPKEFGGSGEHEANIAWCWDVKAVHGDTVWQDHEWLEQEYSTLKATKAAPAKALRVVRRALDVSDSDTIELGDTRVYTHGDLWADHVRFNAGTLSSIIDWDTLARRHPIADIAGLVVDFAGWDPASVTAGLSGYQAGGGVKLGSSKLIAIETLTLRRWSGLALRFLKEPEQRRAPEQLDQWRLGEFWVRRLDSLLARKPSRWWERNS